MKAIQQQQQEITAENTNNTALKQQISLLTSEIADLKEDIADSYDRKRPSTRAAAWILVFLLNYLFISLSWLNIVSTEVYGEMSMELVLLAPLRTLRPRAKRALKKVVSVTRRERRAAR